MIAPVFLNVAVFFWGAIFGLIYFGGLWLTVRRLGMVNHQALWMISSFFIRNLLVVAGFYPVVQYGWQPTLICLAGFILIRFVLTQRIKVPYS
jgi:F1F0 ATPase subunit 2